MEYIYMIIAYKIIQDFKGICITVKADEQIFFPRVRIIGFVQQTVVYSRIKSPIDVCLAYLVIESGGIELNNKIHISTISRFSTK